MRNKLLYSTVVLLTVVALGGTAYAGSRKHKHENGDNGNGKNCKVPEPSTLMLLGTGIAGFAVARNKIKGLFGE